MLLRVTAIATELEPAVAREVFGEACTGWTWRMRQEERHHVDLGTVHSLVVRSRLHFQSIQLEMLDMDDRGDLVLLIYPRRVHGFKLPGATFLRVPVMTRPVTRRIKRFVRAVKKRDPHAGIARHTHLRGFFTYGKPPSEAQIEDLITRIPARSG